MLSASVAHSTTRPPRSAAFISTLFVLDACMNVFNRGEGALS